MLTTNILLASVMRPGRHVVDVSDVKIYVITQMYFEPPVEPRTPAQAHRRHDHLLLGLLFPESPKTSGTMYFHIVGPVSPKASK